MPTTRQRRKFSFYLPRKTANRCHISVEELKDKRIIPFAQKTRLGRVQLCFHSALRVLPAVFALNYLLIDGLRLLRTASDEF